MICRLTLSRKIDFPLDLRNIIPEKIVGKSVDEIELLQVVCGSRNVEFGAHFDVSIDAETPPESTPPESNALESMALILAGDLSRVNSIGRQMTCGKITIDSDVGSHVGAQMSGGEINVRGTAGHYGGLEMSGGVLRIDGNAGDHAGADQPGSNKGMRGGLILVSGNAGCGAGAMMRRGLIAIGGDAGKLAGWNMLAGTILIAGSTPVDIGTNMKRGTIIAGGLGDPSGSPQSNAQPGPTFLQGEIYAPGFLSLIRSWVKSHSFSQTNDLLASRQFQSWLGDTNRGGRGEMFIGT